MRESLKKPILFLVIVLVGSVLVLFDIPLVILLPLVLLVGFVTLLALGSITIAEIRAGIASRGKSGILKRLNDIRFFEKKAAPAKAAPQPAPVKTAAKKEAAKETAKGAKKPGIRAHLTTFVSSIGSLGSVLQQRSRPGQKGGGDQQAPRPHRDREGFGTSDGRHKTGCCITLDACHGWRRRWRIRHNGSG